MADLPLWANLAIVFGLLFLMMVTGTWIAFALAATGVFTLIFLAGGMQSLIGPLLFNTLDSFVLTAVPLFIFAGAVLLKSGLSVSLYRGAARWTGIIPGGLIHTNILSCSIFAAFSGSSVAGAAAIGTIAWDEQKNRGYAPSLILGSVAAGGTLGILIPPSISMIIYGAFCQVPVGRLFIGGIIPGIILSTLFMIAIVIVVIRRPELAPKRESFTWAYIPRALGAIKEIWPMLILIAIVMGGIYLGFMTPTEAAATASIAAIVMAAIHKKLNRRVIVESAQTAITVTGMVFLIFVGARVLGIGMSMIKLPAQICAMISGLGVSPHLVWLLIIFIYLALGCLMDPASLMLLTLPITFPLLVQTLGFDPIWFGIQLVILVEAGLITPPVGLTLYVMHSISGGKYFREIVTGSIPFFICMLIALALVTWLPGLATWLPTTMFER